METNDIQLVKTCECCPEQYDAWDSQGNIVGYIRVRWGYMAAYCPDAGSDNRVYCTKIKGFGHFASNCERKMHLRRAKAAIADWWGANHSK